jgi:hypothetical protein
MKNGSPTIECISREQAEFYESVVRLERVSRELGFRDALRTLRELDVL